MFSNSPILYVTGWLTVQIKTGFGSKLKLIVSLHIQSRPIKMRAPILYLTNRWMDSKMLLTPNIFLYRFVTTILLNSKNLKHNFYESVHFHTLPFVIANFINLRDRTEAAFLSSSILRKQKEGAKRSLKKP